MNAVTSAFLWSGSLDAARTVSYNLRLVDTYSDALSALGDPTRRAIFEHLGERPSAVVDLAALVPVSRPAVSQHLKVLKGAGLVRDERVGTRRVYSLDPDGIAGLRDYLDRFWNTALHSFKKRVEQLQEETNR